MGATQSVKQRMLNAAKLSKLKLELESSASTSSQDIIFLRQQAYKLQAVPSRPPENPRELHNYQMLLERYQRYAEDHTNDTKLLYPIFCQEAKKSLHHFGKSRIDQVKRDFPKYNGKFGWIEVIYQGTTVCHLYDGVKVRVRMYLRKDYYYQIWAGVDDYSNSHYFQSCGGRWPHDDVPTVKLDAKIALEVDNIHHQVSDVGTCTTYPWLQLQGHIPFTIHV